MNAVALDSVEATQLGCERGGRLVFRDVGFRVARGEVLSLEGPNGAGKTSMLRLVAGLLPLTFGRVSFRRGASDISDPEERGRFIGWFGHADGLKAQMTAAENLSFAAALYASDGDVEETLARVGLTRAAHLPGQYLSAGQRRRLGLARLILSKRPLWLMDEPIAALDSSGRQLAVELIRAHNAAGGMVIAATHDDIGIPGPRLTMGAS